MTEKDVYRELLVDKTSRAKALVAKAKGIVGIDEETGEPIILVSRAKLTDRLLIGLYLISKFFASQLELKDTPAATLNELSEKLGIDKDVVSARASDLRREGKVRSPSRGSYEIVFPLIDAILDEVKSKVS